MAVNSKRESDVSVPHVSDLVEVYRRRRDRIEAQQRELDDLEHAIVDAADRESQEILANARRQVREILLQARRDLVVLVAQVQAARDHGAAMAPQRPHVVRAVLDPARPEIDALEAEAAALRATLCDFPAEAFRSEDGGGPIQVTSPAAALQLEPNRALDSRTLDARIADDAGTPDGGSYVSDYDSPAKIGSDTPDYVIDDDGPTEDGSRAEEDAPTGPHARGEEGLVDARPHTRPHALRSRPRSTRLAWAAAAVIVIGAGLGAARWGLRTSTTAPSRVATGRGAEPVHGAVAASVATMPAAVSAAATDPPATLVLEARRPVWMRVRVDGADDPGHLFSAGERHQVRGGRVSIRTGDAGAVFVSENGGAFEALGPDGAVLTREFGKEEQLPVAGTRGDLPAPAGTTLNTIAPSIAPDASPQIAAAVPPAVVSSVVVVPPASVAPAPAPPAASSPATVPQVPAAAAPPATAEAQLERAAESWLGAFFRHDTAAMAQAGGAGTVVDDQRRSGETPAPGLNVRRSFEQVKVEVVGSSAMYTGRLIESGGQGDRYVSLVSQVWLRSGSTWQLLNVRLMPENRISVPEASDTAPQPNRESRAQ